MSTLYMAKLGIIDASQEIHQRFANTYLDYKRNTESAVVYELYKEGNHTLAVLMNSNVDNIINEQMHLKLLA